jgi:2-polyprenyl-6-hydroxyphenyl methylase/3-demethylubiquinone-9 3-methyltransferase
MTAVHLSAPDIDPSEVEYFEKLAHRWWDDQGPFWPLHKLNSFRAEFVRDQLCQAFGRDPLADKPLQGLRVLDIGCGGGILSESVAAWAPASPAPRSPTRISASRRSMPTGAGSTSTTD